MAKAKHIKVSIFEDLNTGQSHPIITATVTDKWGATRERESIGRGYSDAAHARNAGNAEARRMARNAGISFDGVDTKTEWGGYDPAGNTSRGDGDSYAWVWAALALFGACAICAFATEIPAFGNWVFSLLQ